LQETYAPDSIPAERTCEAVLWLPDEATIRAWQIAIRDKEAVFPPVSK